MVPTRTPGEISASTHSTTTKTEWWITSMGTGMEMQTAPATMMMAMEYPMKTQMVGIPMVMVCQMGGRPQMD